MALTVEAQSFAASRAMLDVELSKDCWLQFTADLLEGGDVEIRFWGFGVDDENGVCGHGMDAPLLPHCQFHDALSRAAWDKLHSCSSKPPAFTDPEIGEAA